MSLESFSVSLRSKSEVRALIAEYRSAGAKMRQFARGWEVLARAAKAMNDMTRYEFCKENARSCWASSAAYQGHIQRLKREL